MLDPHNALWSHTITLEVFKGICEHPNIIRTSYKNYDSEHEHKSAKIFHHMVSALGQFVQTMYTWDNAIVAKNIVIKTK